MKALALTAVLCILSAPAAARNPYAGKVVDLTHPFDENTIFWPTAETFHLEEVFEGTTEKGYFYAANQFCTAEHGGTHVDAPIHFAEGKHTVDEIPLDRLMGPAVVVDVTEACAANRDHQVDLSDLAAWEKANGRIPDGSIVLFRTGFGAYWPDRAKYMGTAERGADAVPKLHFPGLRADAAAWLVTERSISAVGIDTPSIDHGPSSLFEAHRTLFENNVPALENVARLDALPATGFDVIALPMKIAGGSGGPCRIVAVLK